MTRQVENSLVFEDVRILFRNFSGKPGTYNREGDRNFCIILEHEHAEKLEEEGWNVKYLKPREEEDAPQPYLPVKVSYNPNSRPPNVTLVTSRGKTRLSEREVDILDWAEINQVDCIVNPYNWDVSGKTGVTAYLKSIYVTIEEDELEQKYGDVPDSAQSSMIPAEEPRFPEEDENGRVIFT